MPDKFTAQNIFSGLQRGLVKRLADGLAEFYKIPIGVVVVAEDEADIDVTINKSVAKLGLCIVVLITSIKRGEADGERAIEIQVSGFEMVIINRSPTGTRVALVDAMSAADGLLDGWQAKDEDGADLPFTPIQFEESVPVAFGEGPVERGSIFSTSTIIAIEDD